MTDHQLVPGQCSIQPFTTIDLGKRLYPIAAWRPFHLKQVAAQRRGIEVAFERECSDEFASSLAQLTQSEQGSRGLPVSLFRELTSCRCLGQLAFVILAFGNRQGAKIAPLPQRASRMDKQHLQTLVRSSIGQNSCASFRRRFKRPHGPMISDRLHEAWPLFQSNAPSSASCGSLVRKTSAWSPQRRVNRAR